jgi:DNA-binding NtrC family response regulator
MELTLLKSAVQKFEKEIIETRLALFEGHKTKTAKSFGIHRNTIILKIKQYGIEVKSSWGKNKKGEK